MTHTWETRCDFTGEVAVRCCGCILRRKQQQQQPTDYSCQLELFFISCSFIQINRSPKRNRKTLICIWFVFSNVFLGLVTWFCSRPLAASSSASQNDWMTADQDKRWFGICFLFGWKLQQASCLKGKKRVHKRGCCQIYFAVSVVSHVAFHPETLINKLLPQSVICG